MTRAILESIDTYLGEASGQDKIFGTLRSLVAASRIDLEKLDALLVKAGKSKQAFQAQIQPYLDNLERQRGDLNGLSFGPNGVVNLDNDDHQEAYPYEISGSWVAYEEGPNGFDPIEEDDEAVDEECENLMDAMANVRGSSYTSRSRNSDTNVELGSGKKHIDVRITEIPWGSGEPDRVEHTFRIVRSNGQAFTKDEVDYVKQNA